MYKISSQGSVLPSYRETYSS